MSVHHALHFLCGVTSWNEFGGWDWDVVTDVTSIFAPRTRSRGRGLDKVLASLFDS